MKSNVNDALIPKFIRRILGRQWITLYRGSDQKRYAQLVQKLTAAGIQHRCEEFDQLSKSMVSSQVPGRSPMDSVHRDNQMNFSANQTVGTSALRNDATSSYSIQVRKRDLAAANQAR